jgi:hypothetical protein
MAIGSHLWSVAVVEVIPSDVAALREQFPGWHFGVVWAVAASGPDRRRLFAGQGVVLVSAWNAAELAAKIRLEESAGQGGPGA